MTNIQATPAIKVTETSDAPLPLGHYSQAVVHNDIAYVSGQLPIDPSDPDKAPGSIEEQTLQTLKNLDAVLVASGSSKDRVLKVTIYISDIAYWAKANEVYASFFGNHKPARAAVPTKELPENYLIEIEAIAALN